jgi:hypothetical protein
MKSLLISSIVVAGCLALAGGASADAPANDARDHAQVLPLFASTPGTTKGATTAPDDPQAKCTFDNRTLPEQSVWFRFTGTGGRLALGLEAAGLNFGYFDVFDFATPTPTSLDCWRYAHNTLYTVELQTVRGAEYFVRVAGPTAKPTAPFNLRLMPVKKSASKSIKPLPASGVTDSVDIVGNSSDGWSTRLTAGVTYRYMFRAIDRYGEGCMGAEFFGPGLVQRKHRQTNRTLCSNAFGTFKPSSGRGGSYGFFVRADSHRFNPQHYVLRIGRARRDDVFPGAKWTGGAIDGYVSSFGLDSEDYFKITLKRRSRVDLKIATGSGIHISLYDAKYLLGSGSDGEIHKTLPAGTYSALVSAAFESKGAYRLTRTIHAR